MELRSVLLGSITTAIAVMSGDPACAQVTLGSATAEVGKTTLTIAYGAPEWSEARKGQIESGVPVGGNWRLGADIPTTLVVGGGDIAIGDQVIEAGGYGLNLRRVGAKEWAFVVFDGAGANVLPDDNEWVIAATTVEANDAPPPELTIAFADAAGGGKRLAVRFGPFEVAAPVAALESTDADLSIAGEQAGARWLTRAAKDAPPAGSFMRVGRATNFYVGDLDGSFQVDLAVGGDAAKVRISNRDKARVTAKVAGLAAALASAKERAGASASPRIRQSVERAEAALEAKQEELAELALAPDPVEVTVPLAAAKSPTGRFGARVVRRNEGLFVVVDADGKSGEAKLEEAAILPRNAD
jgi:hypothetical protein